MKGRSIILFLLVSCISFTQCDDNPNDFDYKPYQPEVADIDSVYFSTGASKLIADGHASLKFVVEPYRKVQTSSGTQDSLVEVNVKDLPKESLQIVEVSSGNEVGKTYSTKDSSPGKVRFYAKIGDTKSAVKEVKLRPEPALPPKLTVNIIFHVFELSENDPTFDKLSYQYIEENQLKDAVEDLNKVFNNKLGNGPNGASANIEFNLAETDPDGNELEKRGYKSYTYKSDLSSFGSVSYADIIDLINDDPSSYIWNPDRYLNIYIMPNGANTAMGDYFPHYQNIPPGEDPLQPTDKIEVVSDTATTPQTYQNIGVGIPRTTLSPGGNRRLSIAPYVGRYYGLYDTEVNSKSATDYCTDTRLYLGSGQFDDLLKTGLDGEKFLANNAMDDIRYPSLRNTLTLDQVRRIRYIIANSPGKGNGK